MHIFVHQLQGLSPRLRNRRLQIEDCGAEAPRALPASPADLFFLQPWRPCGHQLQQGEPQVLAACRAERVLCGVLDELWPEGDLITPATYRRDKLIVSITTSGRSCRQARLVRDNIARHLEMTGVADLLVIGTSHEQLPLEKWEPYHLSGRRLEEAGRLLMQIWGVHEFLVLNTCNRNEFVGVAAQR